MLLLRVHFIALMGLVKVRVERSAFAGSRDSCNFAKHKQGLSWASEPQVWLSWVSKPHSLESLENDETCGKETQELRIPLALSTPPPLSPSCANYTNHSRYLQSRYVWKRIIGVGARHSTRAINFARGAPFARNATMEQSGGTNWWKNCPRVWGAIAGTRSSVLDAGSPRLFGWEPLEHLFPGESQGRVRCESSSHVGSTSSVFKSPQTLTLSFLYSDDLENQFQHLISVS